MKKRFNKDDLFAGFWALVFLGVIVSQVIVGLMPVTAGVKDSEIPANAVTLTGSAMGRNADVVVQVVATDDQIYQINVIEHSETEEIGTKAIKELPVSIFQAQSLKVDSISGSTLTSDAIKAAIINAFEEGGMKADVFGGQKLKVETIAKKAETGSGVKVTYAADWQSKYPDEYESWARNSENNAATDYLKDYPMLTTLYEPYGFSKDYKSARGHSFNLDDILTTERIGPNSMASCWTCKAPEFTALVNAQGVSAYSMKFSDLLQDMNEPISCFNCHGNKPGTVTVTHGYLTKAVGEDFESIDAATLSCGQCHVEYYFAADTSETTLPYQNLETMSPDAILAYYNDGSNFPDGKPFVDYTNPRTGVQQIKVQHPELETFLGEGSQHRNSYTCADCHMGTEVNAEGKTFTSHYLSSPLENTALIENDCSTCHADLVSEIKTLQEDVERLTYTVGYALEFLTEEIAAVVESDRFSEAKLNEIRSLARDAQFYWDFVFVENSEGAHNSALTYDCLYKAQDLCNQAMAILK